MPGGLAGVRAAVEELHAAGVKVMIPYNPWDSGTLRCGPGMATCGGKLTSNIDIEVAVFYIDPVASVLWVYSDR